MSPHPSLVPRGQGVAQISRSLLARAEVDLLEEPRWKVPRTLCRAPVGTAGRVASQLARLSDAPSIKGQGHLFPRRSAIPAHHVGLQARDPASVPWSPALAPSPRAGPTSPNLVPGLTLLSSSAFPQLWELELMGHCLTLPRHLCQLHLPIKAVMASGAGTTWAHPQCGAERGICS